MATKPIFWPGEFHEQRSLVGCSPWGHKEYDTTEQLTHTEYVLEKNGWKNRLQLSLEESSMEMVFYSLGMPTLSIH